VNAVPRVVLDTNVLLDFWVFDDPGARSLRAAFDDGRIRALRSAASDAELEDVLSRPQFGLGDSRRRLLLDAWRQKATSVEHIFPALFACADPHDQKFVELALSAHADALVTKDKALLKLRRRAARDGLRILAPIDAEVALGIVGSDTG
jgi:putative PIN family toxin of toxin-antitoxin system